MELGAKNGNCEGMAAGPITARLEELSDFREGTEMESNDRN